MKHMFRFCVSVVLIFLVSVLVSGTTEEDEAQQRELMRLFTIGFEDQLPLIIERGRIDQNGTPHFDKFRLTGQGLDLLKEIIRDYTATLFSNVVFQKKVYDSCHLNVLLLFNLITILLIKQTGSNRGGYGGYSFWNETLQFY